MKGRGPLARSHTAVAQKTQEVLCSFGRDMVHSYFSTLEDNFNKLSSHKMISTI